MNEDRLVADPQPCNYCLCSVEEQCPTCGHRAYVRPRHVSILTYSHGTKPDAIVELDLCDRCYEQLFVESGLEKLDIDPGNPDTVVVAEDHVKKLCPEHFYELVMHHKAVGKRRERI